MKYILCAALFFSVVGNVHGTSDQQAVLVMGVGKSGTSCVTGVLEIMGVDLGDNLRSAGNQFNIKGTFEDLKINEIDRGIFRQLGINTYHSHLVRHIESRPEVQKYKKEIKQYLKKQFKNVPVFGIKSNRMCLVLPLYLDVLKKLDCTPKLIIVLRHPERIAASRMRRWPNKYKNKEEAYEHMLVYYMNVIEHFGRDLEVLVLYFEDLLNHPEQTVNRIQAFIPELQPYKTIRQDLHAFLDKKLTHQ